MTVCIVSSELIIVLQPNCLMIDYKSNYPVKILICFKVKVTVSVQNTTQLDDTFWTAEPFVTNLGMVMHRHKQNELGCCPQSQG